MGKGGGGGRGPGLLPWAPPAAPDLPSIRPCGGPGRAETLRGSDRMDMAPVQARLGGGVVVEQRAPGPTTPGLPPPPDAAPRKSLSKIRPQLPVCEQSDL